MDRETETDGQPERTKLAKNVSHNKGSQITRI